MKEEGGGNVKGEPKQARTLGSVRKRARAEEEEERRGKEKSRNVGTVPRKVNKL